MVLNSFGWETLLVDGHSLPDITEACRKALETLGRPTIKETWALITVEDHYAEGGLGEAVAAAQVFQC